MTPTRKGKSATSVLSVRLLPEERRIVERAVKDSGSSSIAQYARAALLSADRLPSVGEQRFSPAARQTLLAQILRTVGELDCVRNLTDLATAARLGVLPLTPETIDELQAACEAIQDIRARLIAALGGRKGRNE